MSVETLVKEYQQLSEADRIRFLELIHPHDESSNDVSDAWKAELDKRIAAYESGAVAAIDGKEMEKQLAAKYGVKF
ncbi:MAG: addiction module protein [Bacteroidota bacterium]